LLIGQDQVKRMRESVGLDCGFESNLHISS